MRLEITDDCCATARRLIVDGLDPSELLEFCRGDVVSLRGKASAFARLTVREDERRGPEFVPYVPMVPEKKATLRARHKRPVRLNGPPCSI
jgi:hypothetical protein